MTMRMRGTVHGATIELHGHLDLPDGQAVEVEVAPVQSPGSLVARMKAFRARLLERWGGAKNLSTDMIRQDRER